MCVSVTVTVSELGYLTVTRNVLMWISMPIAIYGLARLDRTRGDSVGPRCFMARGLCGDMESWPFQNVAICGDWVHLNVL